MEEPKRGNIIVPINELLYRIHHANFKFGQYPEQRLVAVDVFFKLWRKHRLTREKCAALWLCELGLCHWEAARVMDWRRDRVLGLFKNAMFWMSTELGYDGKQLPRWDDVAANAFFWPYKPGSEFREHDHRRKEIIGGLELTARTLKREGHMRYVLFFAGFWDAKERAKVLGVKAESEKRALRRLILALRVPEDALVYPRSYVFGPRSLKLSAGLSYDTRGEGQKPKRRRKSRPDKFKAQPQCSNCGVLLIGVKSGMVWFCSNCQDFLGIVGVKYRDYPRELKDLANAEQKRRRTGEGPVRETAARGAAYTQITGEWDDRED